MPGAVFGLYSSASGELIAAAVSDDEGKFYIRGVGTGSYTVKAKEVPYGFALDGAAYPVNARGEGEVIRLEIGLERKAAPDQPPSVLIPSPSSDPDPAQQPDTEHRCPAGRFADVSPDAWYHEAVDCVVSNGLMMGTSDTAFSPGAPATRGMLVTVLYRLSGEPPVSGESPFDDVPQGQWYAASVNWASRNGIVEGYGDGRFGPMDTVTREQFAAILYRYAAFIGGDILQTADLSGFADASEISGWALAAMRWANACGLITSRTETALVPRGTATRGETAAILMRFIDILG